MKIRLYGVRCLCLCLLLLSFQRAGAQAGGGAWLSNPNIEDFPRIQAYLDVHDAQGDFIHGLQAEQVTILEGGNARPVSQLKEMSPGVQVVVAINPGPSFAIRNNKAISRYDIVKDALRSWAKGRSGSNIDDLSLLITDGPAASHTANPAQWLSALDAEQVDPRTARPDLDILFRAAGLVSDPLPRPGMSRAILFITAPPEGQSDVSLENLAAQVKELHAPVFVWMVSSAGAFATQSAQQLMTLSQETGGKIFTFTGEEALPSPEDYLEPLRYIYSLEYESGVNASGEYQIVAQIETGEASIETPPVGFEIELQPPKPAFVAPPLEIQRNLSEGEASDATAAAPQGELTPREQPLLVVFDFPDGRKREVIYSALLVDGAVVSENTQPPFDQFNWELEPYTAGGLHQLQVQARDALGLTGLSAEIPVQIAVEEVKQSPLGDFSQNLPILAVLFAVLAGAMLLLVLVVGGRLRPRTHRAARTRRKSDPVTQPVHIRTEPGTYRRAGWANRLQWPQRGSEPQAYAYLNPIHDPDQPADTLPPIPILSEEVKLGSDSEMSDLVLDDPSVEACHARLKRQEDGSFRLSDLGSTAGTWVNYTPVSKEGTRLEHGDLVHIGRIGFRFTLRKSASTRRPVVITDMPPEEIPPEESR
jgi:hypothetical protein